MPEFLINDDTRAGHPYDALSEFDKGYVEAMFFTNGDTGDDRENYLNELGVERLTKASVAEIAADCAKFLATVMPDGATARDWINRLIEVGGARYGDGVTDDRRAGHMFWYARQGHGVAWTDDYSPGGDETARTLAEGLQKACRKFGECYVETWRGWIHVR